MRIAELSERSSVPGATIKYYTREGMLPPGERVGYNQTDYDERHLARIRLIRALLEVGKLKITEIRDVVAAIDDHELPIRSVLAVAQHAASGTTTEPSRAATSTVRSFADRHDWLVSEENPGLLAVAATLDRFAKLDRSDLEQMLDAFAPSIEAIASYDIDRVAEVLEDRDLAAETVVIGTALGDTLLTGMRRMAQESIARTRYTPPEQ